MLSDKNDVEIRSESFLTSSGQTSMEQQQTSILLFTPLSAVRA